MDNQRNILIGVVVVIIIVAGVYIMMRPQNDNGNGDGNGNGMPPETNTIILYGGEISGSEFGFGLSENEITSPGPILELTQGQETNITFINVGNLPHAFSLTDAPEENADVMFGATVGSASVPISPGGSDSVVFTPDSAGEFYYICPLPGHVSAGMWGNVTISEP